MVILVAMLLLCSAYKKIDSTSGIELVKKVNSTVIVLSRVYSIKRLGHL